jgi:hypothetical protein
VAEAPTTPPDNLRDRDHQHQDRFSRRDTFVRGNVLGSGFGPAQEAVIRGYRLAGAGIGFEITIGVSHSTGGFSGTMTVPGNTTNGVYRLEVTCSTQDRYLGDSEVPFTVDGLQIVTMTTSSTTTTSTWSGLTAVPAPAPGRPLRGTATLTVTACWPRSSRALRRRSRRRDES